jgi:hypothetical protein
VLAKRNCWVSFCSPQKRAMREIKPGMPSHSALRDVKKSGRPENQQQRGMNTAPLRFGK